MAIHRFRFSGFKLIVTGLVVFTTVLLVMKRENGFKYQEQMYLNISASSTEIFVHPANKSLEFESGPKRILIWNKYWDSDALWNKIFHEILDGKCSTIVANNCVFTTDKAELNSSDAILFHLVDMHPDYSIPPVETRNPHQIWIAMTYEPPSILNQIALHFSKLRGLFNRTMTYRQDSDIVVRHGTFLKFYNSTRPKNNRYVSMSRNGDWVNSNIKRNYGAGKRRLVAWFVSDCTSQSGREIYIAELQDYIEVDIYGKCGKYHCGLKKTMNTPYSVQFDDCYFLVSIAYKFVLAFENSICEDYVTEKLYNNLKLNVVPVVFGGANYTKFAPPHSVIDASKYTPKELADYLISLDSNDTLYNEYFEWRRDYYIETNDGVPMACDLCKKLNDPTWVHETKVYEHFGGWITDKCSPGYQRL